MTVYEKAASLSYDMGAGTLEHEFFVFAKENTIEPEAVVKITNKEFKDFGISNFRLVYKNGRFGVAKLNNGKFEVTYSSKNPYILIEKCPNNERQRMSLSLGLASAYGYQNGFNFTYNADLRFMGKPVFDRGIGEVYTSDLGRPKKVTVSTQLIGIANSRIQDNRGLTVGYEIIYVQAGNRDVGDSIWKKARSEDIKELISQGKIYFLNLQIDKAGRLVKKAIDPNDLVNKLGELWSNVAQNTMVLYAHEHKKEAIEVVKRHYQENIEHYTKNDLANLLKGDCQWMVKVIRSGDPGLYYSYDTSAREKFSNLMEKKLMNLPEIIPYWQASWR